MFVQNDGIRKSVCGKTENELEQKVGEYLAANRGYASDTFGAFAITWYEDYKKSLLWVRSRETIEYVYPPVFGGSEN